MQPISFNLIREDILNQVSEIQIFSMIAEESRVMALQMLNKYSLKPQPIKDGWNVLVEFTTRTDPMFKEAAVNGCQDNNSIFTAKLTSDDTKSIVSGRVIVWAVSTLVSDRDEVVEDLVGLPTAFDAETGILSLPDSVDISDLKMGDYLEQTVGAVRTTAMILAFNDVTGAKSITIRPDFAMDLAGDPLQISRSSKIFKAVKDGLIRKEKARC